jgi:uncharacterized protein YjbK
MAARSVEQQRNVFFDCPDGRLSAERIAVRLRRTGDDALLTLKTDPPTSGHAALTRRIELESPVPVHLFDRAAQTHLDLTPWVTRWRAAADKSRPDPAVDALLERLSEPFVAALVPIGAFSNQRTRGRISLTGPTGRFDLEIELDRTSFPGGRTDYELEIELSEDTHRAEAEHLREAVTARLSGLGITTGTAPSKLARFLAILGAR